MSTFMRIVRPSKRPWRPPVNHMDRRVCPDCGSTCHGDKGQQQQREFHLRLNLLLTELCKRTGITEEDIEVPWRYRAEPENVNHFEDAAPDELDEAAEG